MEHHGTEKQKNSSSRYGTFVVTTVVTRVVTRVVTTVATRVVTVIFITVATTVVTIVASPTLPSLGGRHSDARGLRNSSIGVSSFFDKTPINDDIVKVTQIRSITRTRSPCGGKVW